MKYNIKMLIAQKETKEKRNISYRTIAAEAGISPNTLSRMATQSMTQIGIETIDKMCKYFQCGPGDLFIYEPD